MKDQSSLFTLLLGTPPITTMWGRTSPGGIDGAACSWAFLCSRTLRFSCDSASDGFGIDFDLAGFVIGASATFAGFEVEFGSGATFDDETCVVDKVFWLDSVPAQDDMWASTSKGTTAFSHEGQSKLLLTHSLSWTRPMWR